MGSLNRRNHRLTSLHANDWKIPDSPNTDY
jgi:hypothetical protein